MDGDKITGIFDRFLSRMRALSKNPKEDEPLFAFFEQEFRKQLADPYLFPPYHERIPGLTQFGKNFIRSSLDEKNSKVLGKERLKDIESAVKRGENVIFFSNHQIEPDPQILQILLGNIAGDWLDEMIFVAGDRVTKDPIAIPLSMGCNLLCIYSKKYIDTPKEMKEQKLLHNKKTLKRMEELLATGGKMIYVAPSGGRDRKNPDGSLQPAPFDPNSIELFLLISTIAKTSTHFYPLALYTYDRLPPPDSTQIELGEERVPSYGPAHIAIGEPFSKESLQTSKELSKEERREKRCRMIYDAVLKEYSKINS